MEQNGELDTLRQWVEESDNVVFFGGAGVSTESGIPDFRSKDGLYRQSYKYPPETIVSHTFYNENPEEFYRFYRDRVVHTKATPNAAHMALAELEKKGNVKAVVTQNIDGLHQMAGSKEVLELHGTIHRNYCVECRRTYGLDVVMEAAGVPKCSCGGAIRPDVVLYEESLDDEILEEAVSYIRNAEVLIVGGTSLAVYPAAGLIDYYTGDRLVIINQSPTPRDAVADLIITRPIGKTMQVFC